jgi:hypothetical protein
MIPFPTRGVEEKAHFSPAPTRPSLIVSLGFAMVVLDAKSQNLEGAFCEWNVKIEGSIVE